MVRSAYGKTIKRTIFGSFGRYMAILAIIAIGVGFFVGVKNTKACMMETCNNYVSDYALYDFRVISTYGFTEDDVDALNELEEVSVAEGGIYTDFFSVDKGGNSVIIRAHSIPKEINKVNLVEGRMPEKANECVVDDHAYNAKDIGSVIKVTGENEKEQKEALEYKEYKIVGLAKSPYYMTKTERGTTSIGDGKVDAFIYVKEKGLSADYFTELFVICKNQGYIFSDEYTENMENAKPVIKAEAEKQADIRYNDIVDDAQAEIDDAQKKLDDGKVTLSREKASTKADLDAAKEKLDSESKKLESGKKTLATEKANLTKKKNDVSIQLKYVKGQLAAAQTSGNEAVIAELSAMVVQMEEGLKQIDGGLSTIATNEKEIAAGEKQLEEGYKEYYEGKAEANREFAKAEKKLNDGEEELRAAKEELEDLAEAEVFIQKRSDNLGFGSFENNADIVDSIAKVFPVFFFLIAALVCSTTMSRMVEEERTQIGALRALGYTNRKIMLKYMIYSGSAAVIGCVIGFFAGSKYFPLAIWIAYGMMFGFAPLEYYFSWPLAVISLIVAMICSTGTTFFACKGQLANMPAEILRPKAPKAGKRVFLEKIDFIWSRLKFLHKVTIRNILRYKKRMLMMIIGIGGCTALVLAAFGMSDSVAGISEHQYSNIEKYDVMVAFEEDLDDDACDDFNKKYGSDLKNSAVLQQSTVTLKNNDISRTSNLIISDDENITEEFILKSDMDSDDMIPYPKDGEAVINNKMAELLGVEAGDEITVEYDDTHHTTLKVTNIFRNYVNSYMFINDETYEATSGEKYEPTMMYLTFKNGRDVHEMSDRISDTEDIIAIAVNEDVRAGIDEMMLSLNYIIILVILCAGALAFIVLFNLSNINVTERIREIATIEVLGFYPRETGAYVFRENLILVLMGIIVGLPLGYVLHGFIMRQINVDMVSFNTVIESASYIFTVITVLVFTFIVDRIVRLKIKKINMAEALKSIE